MRGGCRSVIDFCGVVGVTIGGAGDGAFACVY